MVAKTAEEAPSRLSILAVTQPAAYRPSTFVPPHIPRKRTIELYALPISLLGILRPSETAIDRSESIISFAG